MTTETDEFPAALLRRAGATRTDVLALEARWTGASQRQRGAFIERLGALDQAGLAAELRDVRDGYDGGLGDDDPMFEGTDAAHQDPERVGGAGSEVPIETEPVTPPTPEPDGSTEGQDTQTAPAEPVVDPAAEDFDAHDPELAESQVPDSAIYEEVLAGSKADFEAYVEENPDDRAGLIEAERAGKARKSWLASLEVAPHSDPAGSDSA